MFIRKATAQKPPVAPTMCVNKSIINNFQFAQIREIKYQKQIFLLACFFFFLFPTYDVTMKIKQMEKQNMISFFYQVHQQIMRIFFFFFCFFVEYQMDIESTDPMETSKVKPKMGLNRKMAVNLVF